MTPEEQLKQAIIDCFGSVVNVQYAKVLSVDKEKGLCIVTIEDVEYPEILLRSVTGTKGFMLYPKVGSLILVSRIANSDRMYVAMMSEIESIVINDGKNGLINIVDMTAKLNELKTSLNSLIDSYNNHVHSVSVTGTATAQTGTASKITQSVEDANEFDKKDYEDTSIMH